ncbi:ROK family transcriptional regulator [Amycolatopsis pittospori]|uniref:ROK family transcriptional regulator n=1 Tax=Amycolatopsis pittospori TaxID=2749434 RepID=UPI0015F01D5F|nr:ROK family protein [Amycolatopsis pittospori]
MLEARELLGPAVGTKEQNRRKLIIEIMIKADQQSILARRLGISGASVSTAVAELVKKGIVEVEHRQKGDPVRLATTRGVALGIDLGFRRMAVIARPVDGAFETIQSAIEIEGANRGFTQLLPRLMGLIRTVVDGTGQEMGDVVSAGLAVPRMIDPRSGRFTTPVLPPWSETDDPAASLEKLLGVRVAVDNDANLGAMAEQTYGLEKPLETVVYIKASTGVGAGIMIGDKLVRGERGMAGEIGHLTVDRDGLVCLCGGRGCLDTLVGAEALISQVRQAGRRDYRLPNDLRALIDAAQKGDAACRRIVTDAGRMLGFALAQLCNLVNPRLVVIGGELAAARELVVDPCRQELQRYALGGAVADDGRFELRTSQLNALAEAHGALILGLRAHQQENPGEGASGGVVSN